MNLIIDFVITTVYNYLYSYLITGIMRYSIFAKPLKYLIGIVLYNSLFIVYFMYLILIR